MASYNGNNIYLSIDGTAVTAYFKSVNLKNTIESIDVTAGGNAEHRQRAGGLKSHSISISLAYEAGAVDDYIQKLTPGAHTIIFGPESNTAGKPRHEQSFILTSTAFEVGVEKPEVLFDISGESAAAPTYDLFANATF